jgi:hypothetical protein
MHPIEQKPKTEATFHIGSLRSQLFENISNVLNLEGKKIEACVSIAPADNCMRQCCGILVKRQSFFLTPLSIQKMEKRTVSERETQVLHS